ncbi:unnamed protein product [Rotaria sordida]|uniref:Uncharacterized protein n=1 Tax=Rotaria sordida TaxID=392033 RepID=A0A815HJ49_9BILA|nr:unnamed protein product [Rotaria sordida]CAF4042913.1 unnamed protein product [Rotaria sordida]
MNKVKPHVLLLCSIIDIGNNRLEQLALDKCQVIDLTFDYLQSPHESLFERFYLLVLPRIINNIQSLTLHIKHILKIITFIEKNCDGILPNLTHLRIMLCRRNPKTGTPFTLGNGIHSILRNAPLLSIVPQFFQLSETISNQILSSFDSSSFMRSIVSIEVDDGYMLSNIFNDHKVFFPQSNQLTHIRITLCYFEDCVGLLEQLGTQLYLFNVSIVYVNCIAKCLVHKIPSILCPNLKHLTITIYRNFVLHKECLVPLLQRFSNVEYLTLL